MKNSEEGKQFKVETVVVNIIGCTLSTFIINIPNARILRYDCTYESSKAMLVIWECILYIPNSHNGDPQY